MNCNEIIEIYIKSLRSELLFEELTLLNEHLKICSECRQALKWDSVIAASLLKDEHIVPSENFVAEVCKEISYIKLPFKHRLYDFVTSSLGIIIPAFIVTVLWMVFNTEIQNILLKIPSYYDKMIYSFQDYFDALPEFKILKEIPLIKPKNLIWLVWTGYAGLIYLIVSLSFLLSSFSDRRG